MTGVYVHIPFCVKKCGYCDFYSVSDFSAAHEYFNAVIGEIESFYNEHGKITADTIFIGGGTPSAVDSAYIEKIINKLRCCFNITKSAEITIETNPKTFDNEKLSVYKACGINRISVGLQSAADDELSALGRIHSLSDFLKAYDMLIKHGFDNINVDIMYGLPSSSDNKKLEKTLSELIKLKCGHISAYALTLSENVPLYKDFELLPSEDEVYSQYKLICECLREYEHYEISNFGKKKCRHNLKYWTQKPYIGFGAAAHSYYDNIRWSGIADIKKYILEKSKKENIEKITEKDNFFEYIMLNLRLNTGIDTDFIRERLNEVATGWGITPATCDLISPQPILRRGKSLNRYKIDFENERKAFINELIKKGYMEKKENILRLTEKGFFVSNSIISRLLSY